MNVCSLHTIISGAVFRYSGVLDCSFFFVCVSCLLHVGLAYRLLNASYTQHSSGLSFALVLFLFFTSPDVILEKLRTLAQTRARVNDENYRRLHLRHCEQCVYAILNETFGFDETFEENETPRSLKLASFQVSFTYVSAASLQTAMLLNAYAILANSLFLSQ